MKRKFLVQKFLMEGEETNVLFYVPAAESYLPPEFVKSMELAKSFDFYQEAQLLVATLGRGVFGIKTIYVNF